MISLWVQTFATLPLVTACLALPTARHEKTFGATTSSVTIPLFIMPIKRTDDPFSVSDYDDEIYQIPLSVGYPSVDVNLTLDSHSDVGNTLFAKKYHHKPTCELCREKQPKRNVYEAGESATALIKGPLDDGYPKPLPKPYSSIACRDTSCNNHIIGGHRVVDDVYAAQQPVWRLFELNVLKNITSLNGDWLSDGTFQYASRLNLSDISVLHLLGGVAATPTASLGGHLIVGSKDTAGMCDEKWVPVSDSDSDLLINGVTIGTNTVPIGSTPLKTTLNIGTAYTLVSAKTLESIVKEVGAEYDFETDTYFAYCDTIPSIPDIVLSIRGKDGAHAVTYRLPANVYFRKTHPTADKCLLMFEACDNLSGACASGQVWHLGSTFLRPYCHLMQKSGDKWTYSISRANF